MDKPICRPRTAIVSKTPIFIGDIICWSIMSSKIKRDLIFLCLDKSSTSSYKVRTWSSTKFSKTNSFIKFKFFHLESWSTVLDHIAMKSNLWQYFSSSSNKSIKLFVFPDLRGAVIVIKKGGWGRSSEHLIPKRSSVISLTFCTLTGFGTL